MKSLLLITASFVIFALAGCEAKEGYAVDELADKAVADKEAYMGKEVIVHGYIANQPRAEGNSYTLSLKFDRRVHKERQLSCTVPQAKIPDEIADNWMNMDVTVKGKIANIHSQNYMDLKNIALKPCELVK
ncbi:MAG: hypothetical protein KF762_03055 [Acidobacteria bacterium]|nr:hypothetical protein [Acidobacteriota bacterium]